MLVTKIIKCKIFEPTKLKYSLLNQEYQNLQIFLKESRDLGLYSANKQQANRFYKKIKLNKEYPLSIRKDLIKIKKTNHKLSKYWVRIPVKLRRSGLWLAIKPHHEIKKEYEICESKILKKRHDFYLYLTIKKRVKLRKLYSSILAIDLGERVMATTVLSISQKPTFYGKEIRGIRRHYAWLRKRLGKKKLLKIIKKISNKEQRKINDILHKISKTIITTSRHEHGLIVLGDVKEIRKDSKGRKFNRILNSWAYYKLTKMIEYKANWEGIKVIKINERGTSHTCSRCGSKGYRSYQGLFKCANCGYQANADYNGAKNILKRSLEYISNDGVEVNQPLTLL